MSTLSLSPSNSISLYSGAAGIMKNMHLNSSQEEIVKNCVIHYSTPRTFCAFLQWMAFRVSELFKGKNSEWQTTQRMIKEHAMELAVQRGLIQRNPQDNPEKFIEKKFSKFANRFANTELNLCLTAQNHRKPMTHKLSNSLGSTDLLFLIDSTKSKIEPIRARALSRQL